MAQRALEKLDMLKKFEKKNRYEMIDARELGKLQLSPFVKTPLTFEFKLDYELSKDAKKRMLTSPHLFEYGQSAFQSIDSVRRPRSAASLQLTRKKHSDKPAVRPFSAPINLKYKSSDKKGTFIYNCRLSRRDHIFELKTHIFPGNLQALGNGFMILKLKTAHSTEVQKRPKRNCLDMMQMLPNYQDTSKILHQTDASCNDFTAAVSGWDGETTAAVEEGDKLNQTTIDEESRNQATAQQLERDSTERFFSQGDLSPDGTNRRSDSLLNIDLTNEIERIIENALCAELKEKKSFIPLCIEDEIEKPNAKIIRVDNQREKHSSSMKMSESFPIYCHNEGYVQKYVLNRWLTLYGDKAFYDTSKKDEIYVHLNPVLQNNFNESLAILGSQKHALANITTKRKKKPIVPKKKPITTSTQVLSLERRHFLPPHSQKERPSVQKLSGSFSNSSRRQPVVQRNISQTIPKCRKDVFMVYGMNPTTDLHHDISASSLISKIKSQFLGCSEKLVGESCKRSRLMMHVDYIPISMPISAHASESELPGHDPTLSAHHPLAQFDSTDIKSIERDQSEAHLRVPDKKCSLDEGRLGGIEFSVSHCNTLVPEGSERLSQPSSKLSPRSFPSESNNSPKPLKVGELASGAEDQEVLVVPHSTVISIPTAQYDSSEPHRNSNMQETMGT